MAWTSKGSLKGPKGDTGATGPQGERGPQGIHGQHAKKGATGAPAPTRDTRARGAGQRCGSGAPACFAGAGELYIDTATGDLYEYEA